MKTIIHWWSSRWILLRMRNVWGKSYRENKNTDSIFLNHAIYEIMWKYNVEPGRPQMARYLRLYIYIHTHTCTHTLSLSLSRARARSNTYCFCTVVMVAGLCLNGTLDIWCVSCEYAWIHPNSGWWSVSLH